LEQTSRLRFWIALIIGLAATWAVYMAMPTQDFQPTGLVLPAKVTRPATSPSDITLLPVQPAAAKELGLVRVEMHYDPKTAQQSQKAIIAYAKQLAAKVGANGLVVKLFGHSMPGSVPAAQAAFELMGVAVYMPNKPTFSYQGGGLL